MNSHEMIALTDVLVNGAFRFKNYGEIVFYNTDYAFDGSIVCAPAFFCRFFYKNKKAGPREK